MRPVLSAPSGPASLFSRIYPFTCFHNPLFGRGPIRPALIRSFPLDRPIRPTREGGRGHVSYYLYSYHAVTGRALVSLTPRLFPCCEQGATPFIILIT